MWNLAPVSRPGKLRGLLQPAYLPPCLGMFRKGPQEV